MGRAERYIQCWSRCPVTFSDSIVIFTMLNEIVSFALLFVGKTALFLLAVYIIAPLIETVFWNAVYVTWL